MKNESIQGLRGVAALMVFFSHALLLPSIPSVLPFKESFFHIFFDGQVAVMIFITISGFFYYNNHLFSVHRYIQGIKRKSLRILLPYVIVMTVAGILCNNRLEYDAGLFSEWGNSFWKDNVSFVEYLKQISVLYPHDTHLINPPTWYILIEVRLFLLIPLIVMLNNHQFARWWIVALFVFAMMLGVGKYYGACILGGGI